jgi:hypothetical protein
MFPLLLALTLSAVGQSAPAAADVVLVIERAGARIPTPAMAGRSTRSA